METYLLLYKYQQTTSYKEFSSLKILQQFQRRNSNVCKESVVCLLCSGKYVPLYKSSTQYHRIDITLKRTWELDQRYQYLKMYLPGFVSFKINLW
jgi:hypothetical protein